MKKLLALVAVLGLSISIVGCSDAKKTEKKADPAPAAPAGDAK